MTLIIIIFCIVLVVILFKKKIGKNLSSEIDKMKDLNYTNDEINYLIPKYNDFESDYLLKIIEEKNLTENEYRAIRTVLSDRNFIIPYK